MNFVHSSSKCITEDDILEIHRLVLQGIDNDNAGKYRNVSARITGYRVVLPNYIKVPERMKEFIKWLNEDKCIHPVQKAALAHYKLVSIHPFIDGNGRTARLLMNLVLMQHGYPCAIIHHKDRIAYLASLEKAQLGGSLEDYEKIITKAVNRSLDIYLKAVLNQEEAIKSQNLMKIGALATATNESISTLRFWTKMNLLPVTEYTSKRISIIRSKLYC